ncbi:putative ABC transporter ATP-binding protein [Mesorhizobium metallidurans STM 2683]|uniref:Putative ABC transporter ATP-binding protein n=1 Tax=Mesorhizobium metallidurans STM 2683 TaxID=1297569 RepID=M5ERP7_9HYPH|nr:sugar ABC transporter ATP-binding protein [Mesorhizobium metallidurans]CCV07534.1 putative ABC transporter ATP-binding protein [Mesorhizobium metallidurans STM 2683]
MLEISGLSKSYGPVHALSDVTFSVEPGKVTALLGENGAGKSTLVKILSGLVTPTAGAIRVNGAPVDLSSPERASRSGVAVVQQEISVLPNLSVAENFMLTQPSRWLRRGSAPALCAPYLNRLGLGHVDPGTAVGELTIGERQLVEIARMLSQDARVLVLDEPTAALADSDIELVHKAVLRLASEGNVVLYITHRLNELDEICDAAVILRNGRLADQFETKDASMTRIVHAMIGRELDELYPNTPARGTVLPAPVVRLNDVVTGGLASPVGLELRPGEIVAVCGQLGSGFVEPLRAIADVSPLSGGAIEFQRTTALSAKAETGVAYCSDDRQLDGFFRDLPVWESMSAPGLAQSGLWGLVRPSRLRQSVDAIAERMTILPAYRERPVHALSGGNAQKVSIGKWLSSNPRILLLEEPTRGVDVGARAEIYRLLRALTDDGLAILFASTDLDEVLGFGERVLVFHDNRLVHQAPSAQLTRDQLATWITHGGIDHE